MCVCVCVESGWGILPGVSERRAHGKVPGALWLIGYHTMNGSWWLKFLTKSLWEHLLIKFPLLQAKHIKHFMWIIQRAHRVYTVFFDFREEMSLAILSSPRGRLNAFGGCTGLAGLPLAENWAHRAGCPAHPPSICWGVLWPLAGPPARLELERAGEDSDRRDLPGLPSAPPHPSPQGPGHLALLLWSLPPTSSLTCPLLLLCHLLPLIGFLSSCLTTEQMAGGLRRGSMHHDPKPNPSPLRVPEAGGGRL